MKKVVVLLGVLCLVPTIVRAEIRAEIVDRGEEWQLVDHSVRYLKTTVINGLALNEEITEAEFENADATKEPNYGIMSSSYVETSFKRLDMYLSNNNTFYAADLYVDWKGIPTTRSFDVIAMRGQGMNLIEKSEMGYQKFYKGNTYDVVSYVYNGTNILINYPWGYGISMNLVDDKDITDFKLYTSAYFTKTTSGTGYVYGAYQHATEDVTLAESKNYKINANGLGGVIFFMDDTTDAKYDQMNGVRVSA